MDKPPILCAHCGEPFAPKRSWARFCHPAHQRAFWALQAKRGAMLAPLLIAAAEARRYKDATDSEMAAYARREADRLVSAWVVEDRKANRSCALVVRQALEDRKRFDPGV